MGVGELGTLSPSLPAFPAISSPSRGANLRLFPFHRAALRRGHCRHPVSLEAGARVGPRRFRVLCSSSPLPESLALPLLPFQPEEVLAMLSFSLPTSLAPSLFHQNSLNKRERHFVHFVLDPIWTSGSSTGASFVAKYGCLVFIENVEQLDIGALVSIRGIGRVSIVNLMQTEPYLRGVVVPMQDKVHSRDSELNSKVVALKESLCNLNSLEIKLKADKDELLQTRIKNSLTWAEKDTSMDYIQAFIPGVMERISFAALQPVSGSTNSELQALQRRKLWAMTSTDTSERLDDGLELIKDSIALVAAKLAIQSVEM
ncbi:hypothetical protein Taro_015886 [Colocasia esculenta]|uniref:Lon N-terminal domain-containing protein n=1 Tax=Colocasia esculenta TaxID=4460 RepID=A0A843URB4_COLES|nr:hypothetical protein [Colocasia esculenta]